MVAFCGLKVRALCPFATELGFSIEEYAAHRGRMPSLKRPNKCSLYIATIEKVRHVLIISCMVHGTFACV